MIPPTGVVRLLPRTRIPDAKKSDSSMKAELGASSNNKSAREIPSLERDYVDGRRFLRVLKTKLYCKFAGIEKNTFILVSIFESAGMFHRSRLSLSRLII